MEGFSLYEFLLKFNSKFKRNPSFLDFHFWKDFPLCEIGDRILVSKICIWQTDRFIASIWLISFKSVEFIAIYSVFGRYKWFTETAYEAFMKLKQVRRRSWGGGLPYIYIYMWRNRFGHRYMLRVTLNPKPQALNPKP